METGLQTIGPSAPVVSRGTSPQTADQLASAFLLGFSEHTRAAYRSDLADYASWLAAQRLNPLTATRPVVEAYTRDLEARKLARSTIARRLATLAGYYREALDAGLVTRSPVDRVRRPRTGGDSQTLGLDRGELRLFLTAAERVSARDRALVELLALNGLRVSEALAADISDRGLERGHCTLTVTGKGGSRAIVPLAPRTCDALDASVADRTEGPLFVTKNGSRVDRHAAAKIVQRVARLASITKHLSPHSLRHSAITAALDAGVPLRDVQDFARHADPRTTRRYDRGRHSLDRHATYRIAAFLADESAA